MLTAKVNAEPKNRTATVPNPFHMISLSCVAQIRASPKTTPTTMHTIQIVKHILLSALRFIDLECL